MKITNPRTKAALHIAGAVAAVAALCALVILIGRGCQKDNDTPNGPQHSVSDSVNTDGEDSQEPDHSGSQVPDNSETSNPGTSDKPPLEDYEDFGDNTEDDVPVGTYKNDKVLSFNYGSGTLYLGVETDTSDAIYLNPSSSEAAASPDKQIGFYIMSSSPELSYSEWEGAEPTDKLNSNRANLVFKDDKFNTAVPAAYHNTVDYGVKWSRSELQLNDDDGGTVLYIRIVQINTGKLLKAFPAQTFNAGIAEQNAMGVASGMAATGLTVFAHSFGCFAARRMFDQAFLAAGYSELPVHVIGSDPGVCAAFNGATHMPFEDCALYMNIPNAVVIDSCDFAQTKALTRKLAACGSPSYMRLIRKGFTTVYADGSDFEIGKGVTLRDGKDVTIIASGILVDEALKAEEMLAAKGISTRVIDMHTWKPLDEELVLRAAAETGCIVTAENHQVGTGLGSAITNLTSAKNPVPVERIGIQNRFGQVGPQDFLMQQYNLTAEDIVAAALRAIARRQG